MWSLGGIFSLQTLDQTRNPSVLTYNSNLSKINFNCYVSALVHTCIHPPISYDFLSNVLFISRETIALYFQFIQNGLSNAIKHKPMHNLTSERKDGQIPLVVRCLYEVCRLSVYFFSLVRMCCGP